MYPEHRAAGRHALTLCLIAFAGLSGSGKSTAIKHLVDRGVATSFYAGEFLAAELAAKGLERTPDNERQLRIALRREYGMGVFADRSIPELMLRIAGGVVLLDAIYCPAEHEAYRAAFGDKMAVVAMAASFETRTARLAARLDRPLNAAKLVERDRLELDDFKIGDVIDGAEWTIDNEGSLEALEGTLDGICLQWS